MNGSLSIQREWKKLNWKSSLNFWFYGTLQFNPKCHEICIIKSRYSNINVAEAGYGIWHDGQSFQYPINWICRDSLWANKIRSTRQNEIDLLDCLFIYLLDINSSTIIRSMMVMHSKNLRLITFCRLIGIFCFFFSFSNNCDFHIDIYTKFLSVAICILDTHKTHKENCNSLQFV